MLRLASLLAPLLLLGCATARTSALVLDEEPASRLSAPSPRVEPTGSDADLGEASASLAPLALEATDPGGVFAAPSSPGLAVAPQDDASLRGNRFTLKGGYWGADEDELDDGYIFNASWMRFFSKLFALEFEAGYLDADGEESGVDLEVWSIPLFLNGRLNAPLWIFDVYGGAGVGTFYYDAEASAGGLSADDDGFLLAGNVFLGASLNVADRIALGLEGKYYITEDADDVDAGLDAYALMLTLGFGR